MAATARRRRLVWIAATGATLLGVACVLRPRPAPAPSVEATLAEEPEPAASTEPPPAPASVHAVGRDGLLPGDTPGETREVRYRKRMAETRQALLEKTRYPSGSRPLLAKTDLLLPHHIEPTTRGLEGDPTRSHSIVVTQSQDRVQISPGQSAVATITATARGAPAALTFSRAALVVQVDDGAGHVSQVPVVGKPTFLDDGNAPDATAGDGTYTATVMLPATQAPGAVALFVDAVGAGDESESGTLLFHFTQTSAPTATFTQTARDVLEDGSIAIYVGVQVEQPGLYDVVGRLYDSTGMPTVYMRFLGPLTTESTEVRLLAFGKVVLDEGGVPPFKLQDVEGAEVLLGQYPDRVPMAEWTGPYALHGAYALPQLSSADYDGEDKQRRIAALDQAERTGIANIRAATPVATAAPSH